jgi:LPS-assembly lipoprotein
MRVYRRGVFGAFIGAAAVAGCGFRPVYLPDAHAQEGLAEIQVAIIPNRAGQLLRQALQARFERGGSAPARRYELYVTYGIAAQGIAIQPDSSVTRSRIVASASWNLLAQDATRSALTSGTARSVDGGDVVNEQFFAADINVEAAQKRVAETIADQITLQLAAYFRRET